MGIADILALLGRPTAAPQLSAPQAKSSSKSRPSDPPVTEEELIEALARMSRERVAAYQVISQAGDARERLLMQPDSDDQLIALARDVDVASLLLERLDRLQPAVENRLLELRDARRAARWAELRAQYLAAGRKHLEDLQRTRLDQAQYHSAAAAVLAEFTDAGVILPRFPFLAEAAVADFAEELSRFATIAFNPRPGHPKPMSLGDRMQQAGFDAERESHIWGDAAVRGAVDTVVVKLKVARQAQDGTWLKIGETIEVTGDEAARMVAAGRAVHVDEEHA